MRGRSRPSELEDVVSIRARHCWRAMLDMFLLHCAAKVVSIRARHCWRAMHNSDSIQSSVDCFNPRPPLLAGDAAMRTSTRPRFMCFNPRPPLLAGDAGQNQGAVMTQDVSIRARHCWRAMLSWCMLVSRLFFVSIRARHCWRAMRRLRLCSNYSNMFQSAPAIAGGRCSALHAPL